MPADVVIARAIRAHTRTFLVVLAAPIVLAGLGAAALGMAGPYQQDPPVVAGLTMLGLGQLLGVIAAIVIGRGLYELLSASGTPGSPDSQQAAQRGQPARVLARTTAHLATMVKIIIAGAVVGVVAWAIIDLSALAGAIVGAVLVAQVAVVVALARVSVLHRTLTTLPGGG